MVSEPLPLVSVVIPVRDGMTHLPAQLEALAAQRCTEPWELVVVDDGSQDATPQVVEDRAGRFPRCTLVRSGPPHGSGHARNRGAAAARGALLVFCDADDMVGPRWLQAHVDALTHHGVTTGPIVTDVINDHAAVATGPPASWRRTPPVGNAFLPYALGANLGVRRDVFETVGGFDGTRPHGNDKVLCWTAALAGHPLHFADDALVHYRLRPSVEGTFRRQRSIARGAPSLYRRFRSHGFPRSSLWEAVLDLARLVWWLPRLRTPEVRMAAARTAGRRLGRLEGSWQERVLYL